MFPRRNYASDDAFGIDVVVKVVVDTSVLEERVKKLLQDKTHLEQLKEAQKREKVLLQKVAQLEGENRKLTLRKQSTKKLKKQFQQASRGLTAVDWFYKAVALWDGGKCTDPKKAIEYLNNAINLQPDDAAAYIIIRGLAYYNLGRHQRAIEDYNKAIRLKPDLARTFNLYNRRGLAYADLGQHQRAIEDYDKAIRLKPDDAVYHTNRGAAYFGLGQHQRAIEDLNEAIRLKPDYVQAYILRGGTYNYLGQHQLAIKDYDEAIRLKPDLAHILRGLRGRAYDNLGQHQRAIQDYDEAIRLKPDYADAYYNRGIAYAGLKQYQRAIVDYNQAIRLKPDDANAYGSRGLSYLLQGKNNLGCRDVQKACALGNCKFLEGAKSEGLCR